MRVFLLQRENPCFLVHCRQMARCPAIALLSLAAFAASAAYGAESSDGKERTITYPTSRRDAQTDDYHGTRVADPYRWLEDVDSEETKRWVAAQNEVTFGYLESIPSRAKIRDRLEQLWNYERFGLPRRRGDRYFYTRNDGLQNQSVLYVAETLDSDPRVLLDPNQLSDQGVVALTGWSVSDNGELLAYGLASAGSDWQTWRVLKVVDGRRLADTVEWVKFSGVSWTPDNKGFFYSRYDEPEEGEQYTGANYYQKLYYHRIGTSQDDDVLVYERPDEKEWGFDGHVSEDGRYLVISVWRGTERKNQIFYKELHKEDGPVVELIAGFDAEYEFLGNDGPVFWMLTDLDAPLRRVVAINVDRPAATNWREVIPESDSVLRHVGLVGDNFFAAYLKDARSQVIRYKLSGQRVSDIELPALGTASGFGGRRADRETFYDFSNFTTPGSVYRYELATGESTIFRQPKVAFDPSQYETRQVFYRSRDGSRIPMFITHKRGLQLNGDNPTLLYGYGGFNIPITPSFRVSNLVWLEAGGVFAVANLRGGGEYGRQWHEAGMLEKKQNVFDDFLAAAQWLIDRQYTSSARLAIQGRSNGGLLVGAAMTQRPDLFAAALPGVGVMDMLRFHEFTIGWAWVSEYGSSADAAQFKTLLEYSPLHNLRPNTSYPATLITTADHDDRVVPGHSFKFAAQLQADQAGPAPVLIRIETSAGHGAGTPTSKRIDEAADSLAFLSSIIGGGF